MAVSNGQNADENTFNSAYVSRTQDSDTAGKIDLNNADVASGTQITNAQREHNSIASFVGKVVNAAKDLLPTWTNNNTGSPTDDLKTRTEALDANVAITDAALLLKEDKAEKGVADGYAELDSSGRIPLAQMSAEAFTYLGTYNATTNTPTLADGVGTTADTYRVSVAGVQDLGSGNITFGVGDKVVYNPSAIWEKWDEDPELANRFLSNLDTPTAVNQTLNTQDINVVGEVGINTVPVTDVPLSIQATASANNGIMTWTDSEANDTWEWSVYDNGYLSLIKNGLTVRSFFIDAVGRVGIGNTATSGRFSVAYPADTLQVEIKGDTGQTADLVNFNDSANNVLSSVNADGSSTWPQVDISAEGEVRFQDATGGEYMGLKAPTAVTTSTTLTLPDGAGANGEVLTTNGTDTLSWSVPPTGGDLWSDQVDASIVPDTDNTYNVGSPTNGFATTYTNGLAVGKNGGGAISLQNNGGSGSVTGVITGGSGTIPSGATGNARFRLLYPNPILAIAGDSSAAADAVATGDLHIETGNKTAGTGDSGSINLYTGTSTGGARGKIIIKDGTEVSAGAGAVFTQTAADGIGSWQAAAGGGGDLWSDPVDSAITVDTDATYDLAALGTTFNDAYFEEASVYLPTGLTPALWGGDIPGLILDGDSVAGINSFAQSIMLKTTQSDQFFLIASQDFASASNTGSMWVTSGYNTGTGNTGTADFQTGQASIGNSGGITLKSGQASSGISGAVEVAQGNDSTGVKSKLVLTQKTAKITADTIEYFATTNNATVTKTATFANSFVYKAGPSLGTVIPSGGLTISSGDVTNAGGTFPTGDLVLTIGSDAGSGGEGEIKLIKPSTAAVVGQVWTATNVDGSGYWQNSAGGGGATTELDNLGTTAINASLIPDTLNSRNLGESTHKWSQVHATQYRTYDNGSVLQGWILNSVPPSGGAARASFAAPALKNVALYSESTTSTGANSGEANIETGNHSGSSGSRDSGAVLIKTGDVTNAGNAGSSGGISLDVGTVAGAGARGTISFDADSINHNQNPSTGFVEENGVTGSRPGTPVTAQVYFDTTLGQPIWYDGTNWVDAQGVTV